MIVLSAESLSAAKLSGPSEAMSSGTCAWSSTAPVRRWLRHRAARHKAHRSHLQPRWWPDRWSRPLDVCFTAEADIENLARLIRFVPKADLTPLFDHYLFSPDDLAHVMKIGHAH